MGEEVWALATLTDAEPPATAVIGLCAEMFARLSLLVEAPLRVRGVWADAVGWPRPEVPYLLVARMAGMEAGVSWVSLRMTGPGGAVRLTATGLMDVGCAR